MKKYPYPIPKNFDIEKDYYANNVIRKEDLIDNVKYFGECRNASEAIWHADKQKFTYLRTKFKDTFHEDINHLADDDGYDLFIPLKPMCPIHGDYMILMNGSGWDYDKWLCGWRDNKTLNTCQYEIEMSKSTYSEKE
jgi:hypothetical protein